MSDRVIDIYTHFMAPGYFEKFLSLAPDAGFVKRVRSLPMLYDLEARRRLVGQWPGYQQLLTPAPPGPERVGSPESRHGLARLINEGLATIVRNHPDEFPAFVAAIRLDNIEEALAELDYAVDQLGARGVQIYTNMNGKPMDGPEFEPLWAALSARNLPAWLHPTRGAKFSDYETETGSRYEIWQVLGWPYETAACIARLVFSGVFDRHPGVRIVTHHLGGIIPYLQGRIGYGWDELGSRTEGEAYGDVLKSLKSRPIDYFRRLYGDTAVCGAAGTIHCGLDFFGPERVLFGSDCPFDPEGGPGYIRETMRAVDSLGLPTDVLAKIRQGNARELLKLG